MTMNPWTAQQVMEARNADLRRKARRQSPRGAPRSRGTPSPLRLRLAASLIRAGWRVGGPAVAVEEVLQLGGLPAGAGGPGR